MKYLLAILNSSTISFFNIRRAVKENRTLFPKIVINGAKNYPIKKASIQLQTEFESKVDEILSLTEECTKISDKFLNRLLSNYKLTPTTKLIEFYNNTFVILLEELKKQKISLNLKQQDDWEEYFNEFQNKLKQIKTRIDKIDKEINEMVYNLYDLKSDEIDIIEKIIKV